MKCKKHDINLECLAGHSAHPDNWYCPECDKETTQAEETTEAASPNERVVSGQHLKLLEHTLGDGTHYRNYFLASDGHREAVALEELVDMGLMVKQAAPSWTCGDTVYRVTEEGKKLAFAS